MTNHKAPEEFTRRRLAQLAEHAIRGAEVAGVFPTPIAEVQRFVGVAERLPMSQLPKAVSAKKPALMKRVLGAYLRREKTIVIDTDQFEPRVLFTEAHETIHAACGWHDLSLYLDSEDELFRDRVRVIEGEANYGAGHLIFQGGRFHRLALQDAVSLAAPLGLADRFGASREAAAHYYAEEHPDAVALLKLGLCEPSGRHLPNLADRAVAEVH